MKLIKLIFIFFLAGICLAMSSCQQNQEKPKPAPAPEAVTPSQQQIGPVQQLGKEIDESLQRAKQKLQKLTEPGGTIDQAGKQLQKTIQDTNKNLKKSLNNTNQQQDEQQSTTNP